MTKINISPKMDRIKQEQTKWISVEERVPEPNVRVLVCLTYGSGKKEIQFSHWEIQHVLGYKSVSTVDFLLRK